MSGLIGKKLGMTQIFTEAGDAVGVTVVAAGPCVVCQVRTEDTDGYNAIQLGYDDAREKVEVRPRDPRRGLEVSDCEVGPYSIDATPEIVRENRGLAPRGALLTLGNHIKQCSPSIQRPCKTDRFCGWMHDQILP